VVYKEEGSGNSPSRVCKGKAIRRLYLEKVRNGRKGKDIVRPSSNAETVLLDSRGRSDFLGGDEMSSLPENLFEVCREKRYRQLQHRARKQTRPAVMLTALLDRVCLDGAEKYRLDKSVLHEVQIQLRSASSAKKTSSLQPVWMEFEVFQPLDSWSEDCVAALYIRPPITQEHVNKLPPALRPRVSPSLFSPQGQWHLELINPDGDCLLSYHFEPSEGAWSIAPQHACPWKCCTEETDEHGEVRVLACTDCLSDLEYVSRWLCTTLASLTPSVLLAADTEEVEVIRKEIVPPRPWELWKVLFPGLWMKQSTATLRYTFVHDL